MTFAATSVPISSAIAVNRFVKSSSCASSPFAFSFRGKFANRMMPLLFLSRTNVQPSSIKRVEVSLNINEGPFTRAPGRRFSHLKTGHLIHDPETRVRFIFSGFGLYRRSDFKYRILIVLSNGHNHTYGFNLDVAGLQPMVVKFSILIDKGCFYF